MNIVANYVFSCSRGDFFYVVFLAMSNSVKKICCISFRTSTV